MQLRLAFASSCKHAVPFQDLERAPGDFANVGFLGVPNSEGIVDPEARKRSLNSELANGRLVLALSVSCCSLHGGKIAELALCCHSHNEMKMMMLLLMMTLMMKMMKTMKLKMMKMKMLKEMKMKMNMKM